MWHHIGRWTIQINKNTVHWHELHLRENIVLIGSGSTLVWSNSNQSCEPRYFLWKKELQKLMWHIGLNSFLAVLVLIYSLCNIYCYMIWKSPNQMACEYHLIVHVRETKIKGPGRTWSHLRGSLYASFHHYLEMH